MTEQSTPKMTHNEMIDVLKGLVFGTFDRTTAKEREALDMAISALTEELSEDGTLTVHVADGSKVSRVFVKGDNIFGGLYYHDSDRIPKNGERFSCPNCGFKADWYIPDSAENKGEWIPVTERLPGKDMACLVAVGLLNLTQFAIYSDLMGVLDHRIFYQGDVGHDSFEDITEYVKAWQPLPEPYKENDT